MNSFESQLSWDGVAPDRVADEGQGWTHASWDVAAGEGFSAVCRLPLPKTAKPFWCVPGLFWGDNQQDGTGQYYPRFRAGLAAPAKFESSYWEFHVWRAAQPVVGMFDGTAWWLLQVEPDVGGLCASVGFEYENGYPVLMASLPARERPYRPVGHDYTMPQIGSSTTANARRISWSVRALRVEGSQNSILGFLQENYHAQETTSSQIPHADCAQATRNALMKWHYNPREHYFRYTVAFDRVGQQIAEAAGASLDRHEMSIGWASGWVVFEALLDWAAARGDTETIQAVEDTWNSLTRAGLTSPSGFWWTRFAPSRGKTASIFDSKSADGMDGNWMADPGHLHLRTLGDAVLRAARSLRKHRASISFAEQLCAQIQSQAELVASFARSSWPIPMSVDAHTGKPAGLRGTAGMIWISVWAELHAQGIWSDNALITAGLEHHRADVESGQLFGAPEDVGESVTSEDIYIAVNTYLDGYRVTHRPEDLETAVRAAQWLYLWRKSFDHHFDPRTLLGAYGLKSRGGDLASVKNNHLHVYGLDVEEGLLELARLTGDVRWRQLADEHWCFAAQLTPLVDGQFNGYEGMVAEQFYFIDWSALGNSVRLFENDSRRASYDVGTHYRNHGNLAGFSHAWCTAFVLRSALRRMDHDKNPMC